MRCPPSGRSGRGCCIATLESSDAFTECPDSSRVRTPKLHLNEPTVHGGSAHTHQHVLAVMMPCPRGSSCPLPALWQLSEISRAGQHNIACKISLRKFCVRTLDGMIISPDPTSPLSCGVGLTLCVRGLQRASFVPPPSPYLHRDSLSYVCGHVTCVACGL